MTTATAGTTLLK